MRLDAVANDSTTNISRNRVSFNMTDSDHKEQNGFAKLSANIAKKMSSTSNTKVRILYSYLFLSRLI